MSLILEALKKSEKERQGKADTGSAAAATPAGGPCGRRRLVLRLI